MSHPCPHCGLEHQVDVAEPVVVETEPVADAAVEVARIEADRDVTIARIGAKQAESSDERWQENRVAELEGRLAGMQEIINAMAPPPAAEPVPIVIDEPEPEPVVEEPAAAPPPVIEDQPKPPKKKNPWWG